MKNTLPILALLCIFGINANSQKKLKVKDAIEYNYAVKCADGTNYREAIPIFRKLHNKYSNNIDICFNLGLSYLNASSNPDSALYFLNKTMELDTDTTWTPEKIELQISIARVHQLKYQHDEALAIYARIEQYADEETKAKIERDKSICITAKKLIASPVKRDILSVEDINSSWNDYRALPSADGQTMIFTSRRPDQKISFFEDGQFEEHLYQSKLENGRWTKPELIRGLFDKYGQETATCLSVRSDEIYMHRNGDIYVSKYDSISGWSKAEPLPEYINSEWNDKYPFVSNDGNELFFASNRPGGFGGYDIYRCYMLPNGQWGLPRNLGETINTKYDEIAPVMHPSGNTLYFCSEGHENMGGFDIFYASAAADSTFTDAQNIGYPINTPDDDLYFMPTTIKNMAYYASIEWKNDSNHSFNIYEVDYQDSEMERLAVVKGVVRAVELSNIKVSVYSDGEAIGRYRVNPQTGRYVIIVEAGKQYEFKYQSANYLEQSKTINIAKEQTFSNERTIVELDPIYLGDITKTLSKQIDDIAQKASLDAVAEIIAPNLSTEKIYTVQIMSLRKKLNWEAEKRKIKLEKESIFEYEYRDGWYVYSFGTYKTAAEANEVKKKIVGSTYMRDSFVRNAQQYNKFIKNK